MHTYYLKILYQTSTPGSSRQCATEAVKADGWWHEGEGRIYHFWKYDDEGKRETVACYPTNCTIIEKAKYANTNT